ncbi:CRISPR-associated helicase Cas3' [Marinobacter sp. SS21]|uniref:CRISPR-associated helicase Cas3' n=1 Tax=Marinobacter sp. SS21 TaxID=2979460 RepID=UPI00232EE17F|nr:CRISPR-associated helicase Cas3' [Marinobacter sp. SS21]MDC0662559.1 CRISPR-associated helicase Cas3' [Marinobacter sp. SS21]
MRRFRRDSHSPVSGVVPYQKCPAKTYESSDGVVCGRSVESHCRIVGEVAKEIVRRSSVATLFPEGACLAAACHDIGKVSPTFYNKIMRACSLEQIPGANPDLEKGWGGHAGVSQLTARKLGAPRYVPEILGRHHGFSPNLAGKRAEDEIFGGAAWLNERESLVQALRHQLAEDWPQIESAAQARLVAGLTSVADWIGSGNHFENPELPWEGKIAEALNKAGFVPVSYQPDLGFEEVFGFAPRQAQAILIEKVSSPGVYVLEAPMGLGKTEAALYAAYRMLDRGQASGIYFALPTQLTSNKIFERFQNFLERVLAEGCSHRSLLLHANAWLLETEMGEEGRPGGAWFNQGKRGLLAPFAVGTIDQALMAAMNVKHGFVRAFGLAGKVVILDEVHTYDAYTGTLLDALVRLLRELGCTVIILSATLNQERRAALLGRPTKSMEYPLITACPTIDTADVSEVSVPAGECRQLRVSLSTDEALAVEQALLRAEQGQQVLWIENTVKEAQQRYLDLAARAAELGVGCGLLHSRFTVDDRQRIEDRWVNLYGKAGWPDRLKQGRILVGTQVLEQSLDIDADFMISRFAPTDMLLQRLGRVWRHEDTPRCKAAEPEVWLLAPALNDAIEAPQKSFGASAYVYSPYVLCRSLEAWQNVERVSLPGDIRQLIECTYEERQEQGSMERWLHELDHGNRNRNRQRKGRIALQQLARIGLAEDGNTLPESKAQTRYSESDSYEVLMLKGLSRNAETACLTLMNGSQVELPLQRYKLRKAEWKKRTATLMRQIVNVPPGDKPKAAPVDTLKRFGLHHCFFLGRADWPEDESVLRVALVDETDALRGIENTGIHDSHLMEYRDDLGYRVIKNQGN